MLTRAADEQSGAPAPWGQTRKAALGRVMGVLSVGAVLAAAGPTPPSAWRLVLRPPEGADPFAPVVALIALVAWILISWLVVVGGTTMAGRLPGSLGQLARAVGHRIAPVAVRRLLEAALGVSVAVGGVAGVGTPAASAAVPAPPPWGSGFGLDWPTSAPTLAYTTRPVVVRPGDSLWTIAQAHLPADAPPSRIAQAWPAWWAANRSAVGPDPGLIRPGLSLTPPSQS